MTEIDVPLKAALDEIEQLVLERHKKYGPSNVADAPGGPLNGLRVRLYDKLARLNNYVDNGGTADFADDSLRDCFLDVVGYGLIGLLVLDDDWPDPHAQIVSIPMFGKDEDPAPPVSYQVPNQWPPAAVKDRFDQRWEWFPNKGYWWNELGKEGTHFSYEALNSERGPLVEVQ